MGLKRPAVWLVSPAWQRFAVTRIVLAQRAHLAGELAARGIDCHSVLIADDENLEIAREYGCETIEMDNDGLGRRFNAGFQFAAERGADYLVHIGSDDWIHPDVFSPLLAPLTPRPILTGTRMAFVDLATGRLKRSTMGPPHGVIPWIIPRELLEPCDFAPIRPMGMRGMDGDLVRGLRKARVKASWVFDDPHDLARIDFKSDTNINSYDRVPGNGRSDAWAALAEHYPADLVEMARSTSTTCQEESNMPKLRRPDGRIVSVSPRGVESRLAAGYTRLGEAPAPASKPATDDGLDDLSRKDLDAQARTAGVDAPDKLPNKGAVADAIRAAQASKDASSS